MFFMFSECSTEKRQIFETQLFSAEYLWDFDPETNVVTTNEKNINYGTKVSGRRVLPNFYDVLNIWYGVNIYLFNLGYFGTLGNLVWVFWDFEYFEVGVFCPVT